jgi:hypothetical protein
VSTIAWNHDPTPITVAANGDWRIRLASIHQDVIFGATHRQTLIHAIMRLFAKWVIDGAVYLVVHSQDTPWDQSGETVEIPSTEHERLTWCPTLGVWMEQMFTGSATPTYLAGCGLAHDTYADEVDQLVLDDVASILEPQVPSEKREAVVYDDDFAEAVCAFHDAIVAQAGQIATTEAYRRCAAEVRRAQAARTAQGAVHRDDDHEHRERAMRFWATHLPGLLVERRIDERTWQHLDLAASLRDTLADADPADVKAIAAAGLPGCPCSPAVTAAVRSLAAEIDARDRDSRFCAD